MKRRWTKLSVSIPSGYQDPLIGLFRGLKFNGFHQLHDRLECYVASSEWNGHTKEEFVSTLAAFRREFPRLRVRFKTISEPDRNWNDRWERSFTSVRVSKRFLISPSWGRTSPRDRGRVILEIDPKMSFGTGHHESTRLSLRLLELRIQPADRVLDFGCGTGILAIASAKLGAKAVTAVDIDPWATTNARENVRRNHVAPCVRVLTGGIERIRRRSYDVVASNIDLQTIARSLNILADSLVPDGFLIVSGVLVRDFSTIRTLSRKAGLTVHDVMREGAWGAVTLAQRR